MLPDLDALLDCMTLEEQVSLLSGADFWHSVPIARLGIPAFKVSDGPNGARGGKFKDGPSTACFPVGIALGATWDVALVQQAGAALGREAKLKAARVLLAPTINLQRTVYNGRNFECHSEDPWLASEMAVAYVTGVQSQGVAATVKHFVGNESEYQRMTMDSRIPERALRELYLLPFERAVKEAGAMCVMTGYNHVNGPYMADHKRLIDEVLRKEWGFDGLVMTDWMARHDTVESVAAGCDLEMPGPARERGAKLVAAVREGRASAVDVRARARAVLQLAARLGSFADPTIAPERADDVPEHRALIRKLGAAGAVLLKNGTNANGGANASAALNANANASASANATHGASLLPLDLRPGAKVALIGRAATVPQIMGGGSATVNAQYRSAPADALREACPGVTFTHSAGADIHRFTPVMSVPMTVEYFANPDLQGPVVATETIPTSEALWIDAVPAGVVRGGFSARTRLRYVADAAGEHVFSLMSAGVSRARLNGQAAIDAWTNWTRGDSYFTFGCDEVIHRRTLAAGDVVDIEVEYSTRLPDGDFRIGALRIGAARALGDADIAQAVQAARDADAAIVFAGLNAEWDNEGLDRPGIELPHRQNELIAKVAAANPRTVVVLQSGSPLLLPWLDDVRAVLQAWYPGQECGHAIADVLLGHADPGGRLPQTWPLRIEDTVAHGRPDEYPGVDGAVHYREGVFIGYRHHDAKKLSVQFAFGHGLSYTSFAFDKLELDRNTMQPGDTLAATVTVRNTGTRAGSTVVQAYVHDAVSTQARPPQELKAFAKVTLQPGEARAVKLTFGPRAFAAFDEARSAWVAEAGKFELRVGPSSAELLLRAGVALKGEWVEAVGSG